MSKTIKNATYYTLGSVLKSAASFLFLPIFSNALGAEQYGVLNLLQTFSSILGVLMTLSTERSLFRLYYDYKTEEGKTQFLSTVFWTISGISMLMILLILLTGQYIVHYMGDVDVMHVLFPTIIYTYLLSIVNFGQILMQVEQKGKSFFVVSVAFLIVYNVSSLLFLYYYSQSVESLVYGQLLASLLVLPFVYKNIKERIRFFFSAEMLKNTLKYSIPLFISITFAWVLHMTDRLFIANLATMEDAGVYSLASKFSQLSIVLITAIHQSYSPMFYNIANTMPYEQAKNKLMPINKMVTASVCIICILVAIFTKPVLALLFTEEYKGAMPFVYLLSASCIFTQQCVLFNVMVYQNKKVKSMSLITILSGILCVVLNSIFIPIWGAIAAGVVNLVVGLSLFSMTFYLAKQNYYIPICIPLIMVSIVTLVICSTIDLLMNGCFWELSLKIIILLLVISGVFAFKIVNIDEVRVIISRTKETFMKKKK